MVLLYRLPRPTSQLVASLSAIFYRSVRSAQAKTEDVRLHTGSAFTFLTATTALCFTATDALLAERSLQVFGDESVYAYWPLTLGM
jgi:hypothetical protein